jgi:hypothetical protein
MRCPECYAEGGHERGCPQTRIDRLKPDLVNHPPHYTSHPSGIECIELTRLMGFDLGNAFKYLWRCNLEGNKLEDLKKALWYLIDCTENRVDFNVTEYGKVLYQTWGRAKMASSESSPLVAVMGRIVDAHYFNAEWHVWKARIELAEFIAKLEAP